LRTQFKADIAVSAEARADALAFLRCIATQMSREKKLPEGRPASEFPLRIGSPADPLSDHEAKLKEIATEAGFAEVFLVEEPVASLTIVTFSNSPMRAIVSGSMFFPVRPGML